MRMWRSDKGPEGRKGTKGHEKTTDRKTKHFKRRSEAREADAQEKSKQRDGETAARY